MQSKTYFFISLLLILCILLSGCNNGKQPAGENPEGATTPASNPEENDAYLQIPLRDCPGYIRKYYGMKDSNVALQMKFYEDWEHREDGNGGYLLLRDGMEIGRIVSGEASDVAAWTVLAQKEVSLVRLQVTEYLEKSGTGESLRFRHRYHYRYVDAYGKAASITVTIAYGEIDTYTQIEFRGQVLYKEHRTDPMYGVLSHVQDKPILVLGNSFVASSEIAHAYNSIAISSNKSQRMTGQARGYATVGTYAEDTYLLSRIMSGEWGAVFMCGFYGYEVEPLGVIKEACDASGTQLIIFPAHNENNTRIEQAREAYPDLVCINWKREIEQLIAEGRSKWDFCIDDEHLHSTPLAGYVGAMMIWRAIWGEMPAVEVEYIPQDYYDPILGDYLTDPSFEAIKISNITFLE